METGAGIGESNGASWRELVSEEDLSRNFVQATSDGGAFECRYVRRETRYFIVYLSSHSGCRQACRFCHLTQTGQTMMKPAGIEDFLAQADRVLAHADREGLGSSEWVNFNFMARGEALLNPVVLEDWSALAEGLAARADTRGPEPRFNISSILPVESAGCDLTKALPDPRIALYYSLYALDEGFRRRWLPKAQDPVEGLARLARWQGEVGGQIVLHWALIEGENDSLEEARRIADRVKAAGISARFNLVRYNPFGAGQGRESGDARLEAYFSLLAGELGHEASRIVPRVGFDVKASCGMFVEKGELKAPGIGLAAGGGLC